MDKKFNISDKSVSAKIIYGAVIAILCISAIVIGIVSAASRVGNNGEIVNPPITDNETPDNNDQPTPPPENTKPTFIAPVAGTVVKDHSLEQPVFSVTLDEWRVHTGIDISCEEGSSVYSSCAGVVSRIYTDPMLGETVEITHANDLKTRYSNLSKDTIYLNVGDTVSSGDRIGTVGDTSVSELAEESHLHFDILLKDVKVNPLDYISEESKKSSLGM